MYSFNFLTAVSCSCDKDSGTRGSNVTRVSARTACVHSCERCVHCALGYGVARMASNELSTTQQSLAFTAMIPFLGGMSNFQDGDANFNRLCDNLFKVFHSNGTGSICFNGTGPTFEVFSKRTGKGLAFAKIQCKQGGGKTYTDLGALITVCTMPCETDNSQKCCYVPRVIAQYFPCCRSLGCRSRSNTAKSGVSFVAAVTLC